MQRVQPSVGRLERMLELDTLHIHDMDCQTLVSLGTPFDLRRIAVTLNVPETRLPYRDLFPAPDPLIDPVANRLSANVSK